MDFLLKKLCESFVRNVFIYTALFFGEKYMIEVLTKKFIDSFIFNNSKVFHFYNLGYGIFFFTLILVIFYTLVFYMFFSLIF